MTWRVMRNIAKTHDAPVVVMKVDPTDTLLATGSSDGTAKVWDLRGGFCTHVFRNHGGIVSALEWNMPALVAGKGAVKAADRTIELFSGSMDGKIRLWNLKQAGGKGPQKPSAVLESHFSVIRGLAVNSDGSKLVSAGRDRLLTFWERQTASASKSKSSIMATQWKMTDSLTTGEAMESAGFLSGSNDAFWTAGSEGEIRLWSFEKKTITNVQPMGRFARGVNSKKKVVQNIEDEDKEEQEDDETKGIVQVHALPLLNILVSVHADQNIVFRSVPSLQRIRRLVGFNDQIIDMALLSTKANPDSHLAVAANTNTISVYSLGSDKHSVELLPGDSDFEQGHSGLILCLDKTTDGTWLASGGKDRSVRIWARVAATLPSSQMDNDSIGEKVNGISELEQSDMEWRCVAVAEGHTESVGAVAFARRSAIGGDVDGTSAPFLISGSQDRTAKVWDLSKLPSHIQKYSGSPLQLQSLTTLKIHDKDINALDVSPNNALLLTGSQDKTAKVFSINYVGPCKANDHKASASLKLITTCRGHKRGVWSVAFSPNDAVFLTGSGDRSMKLWSITNGFSCIKNYIGHTNSILKVRFLKGSKGLQCLSCASDGLIKVWNVKTEECMDTLDGHEDRIWGLECFQDGDVIISGAADSLICFWKDWTIQEEEGKVKERQEEVEREQQFVNLLAVKDYRNAISLALAMNQPRRLYNLFSAVDSSRVKGDSTTSTGDLLNSALQEIGNFSESKVDPSLQALVQAGVLSSASARIIGNSSSQQENDSLVGPNSITGSSSVDQVIETLRPAQLRTLFTFVRDWNTSARTSQIAQLILHAILRFHSAEEIVSAYQDFDKKVDARQDEEVIEENNKKGKKKNSRDMHLLRQHPRDNADLKTVVEAILPYTKRHYDRAQRLLTESAMLQYTLACMDSVLGAEGDEEEDKKEEKQVFDDGDMIMNGVHGESQTNSDVDIMSDADSDE